MKIHYPFPTIVSLLRWRARMQPDQLAYSFLIDGENDEVKLSYGDLDRRARSVATFLQSLKASGERVLLLYPPGLDYIAAFFGCLYAGAIAVPVYPPRHNKKMLRIAAITADARPAVALTTSHLLEKMSQLLATDSGLNSMRWEAIEGEGEGGQNEWLEPLVTDETLAVLRKSDN